MFYQFGRDAYQRLHGIRSKLSNHLIHQQLCLPLRRQHQQMLQIQLIPPATIVAVHPLQELLAAFLAKLDEVAFNYVPKFNSDSNY